MSEHTPVRRPAPGPDATRPAAPSGGQALDRQTNARMSARFGHDFSSVRVHTDARADESAQAAAAGAFAVGPDIVFGRGRYNPGSSDTDRLLAHELTHVVQQARFGPGDPTQASDRADESEREAECAAADVAAGRDVAVRARPGALIARADPMPDPPDIPPTREKEKPGGPTDWNDQGFGFTWDWGSILPKSGYIDPGKGDPLQIPMPWGGASPTPSPAPGGPTYPGLTPGPTPGPAPLPTIPGLTPWTPPTFPGLTPPPTVGPQLTPPTFQNPFGPPKPPLIGGDLPPLTLAPTPGVLPPVPPVQLTPPSLIAPQDDSGS